LNQRKSNSDEKQKSAKTIEEDGSDLFIDENEIDESEKKRLTLPNHNFLSVIAISLVKETMVKKLENNRNLRNSTQKIQR